LLWLCWCTESTSLLTAVRCANGGGGVGLGHAGWRKTIFSLQMRLLGVNGRWLRCGYLSHWLCHSISPRFLGDMHEKRGTISSVFTFFPVTVLVNAPLVSSAGGAYWHAMSDGCFIATLTKQLSVTGNVTSVNLLCYHDRAKKEEKYKLYTSYQTRIQ
jgi:hypothetical protein